jgi:hypothetical protein
MTWSLQIAQGDFTYGAKGLNTATGGTKLVQDLSCWILEPMGDDNLHPTYGSVIEGGVDPSGTVYSGYIGSINNGATSALINAEIQRIAQAYQSQQVARNQADLNTYGMSTLSVGEALLAVDNIAITQVETAMAVSVSLTTGNGSANVNTMVGSS